MSRCREGLDSLLLDDKTVGSQLYDPTAWACKGFWEIHWRLLELLLAYLTCCLGWRFVKSGVHRVVWATLGHDPCCRPIQGSRQASQL
jgi:hypothetical protein